MSCSLRTPKVVCSEEILGCHLQPVRTPAGYKGLEPWMLTYVWDLKHIKKTWKILKKHFGRKKTYTGLCFLSPESQGLLCCRILVIFWSGCRDLCIYLSIYVPMYVLIYLPTYLSVSTISHLSS